MNIQEMNRHTIQTSLNAVAVSIDEGIRVSRMQYENINNDYFKESKEKLEMFLFRLFECKYLFEGKISDLDRKRYLTEDEYYKKGWGQLEGLMDLETGQSSYEKGVACVRKKDYIEAGRYFRESALAGHAGGQFNYGVIVSNGEGCEADELEGAFWYWEAAKHGNSKAMMNLAIAYRNSRGVKGNGVQMLWWYACSAEMLDNPTAVYNLGLSLKREEVLEGNGSIGRLLVDASDELEGEKVRSFVKRTASQIKEVLKEYVYNVE